MKTIPAQEIKRRGIAAVDDLLATGDVHVIKNNQPQYVVVSEVRYQELMEAHEEAYIARVLVKMRLGGESNRSLGRIWLKTREDFTALKRNRVGGLGALVWKNVGKVGQFL